MLKVMTTDALVFLTNHLFALTFNLLTRLCFTNMILIVFCHGLIFHHAYWPDKRGVPV